MSLQFLRQLSKNALDRFKVRDLGLTAEGLEAWGKTDFGCYLRHHEHRVLRHKYALLPGYRLMHLGLAPDQQLLDCFDHMHRFSLSAAPSAEAAVISNYSELQ